MPLAKSWRLSFPTIYHATGADCARIGHRCREPPAKHTLKDPGDQVLAAPRKPANGRHWRGLSTHPMAKARPLVRARASHTRKEMPHLRENERYVVGVKRSSIKKQNQTPLVERAYERTREQSPRPVR